MEDFGKGKVTSFSSIFPPEEAQKASKRVQDMIVERQKELDQLRDFIADNNNLVNLVQRLPDQLHHDIMVPFGKAAFFPGRLIHTNEFLVLLGEGYYTERTSKQTIEILKRRGMALSAQVESLKAVMQDLKAEASFFDATASEAAEGLVEIREDYIEETAGEVYVAGPPHSSSPLEAESASSALEDEEYNHIFSRIAELEKEEEEAESSGKHDNDEGELGDLNDKTNQQLPDQEAGSSKGRHASSSSFSEAAFTHQSTRDYPDQYHVEVSKLKPDPKDGSLCGIASAFNKMDVAENPMKLPEVVDVDAPVVMRNEAFTGTVIERIGNIEMSVKEQIVGRSSKPVSRFKMQKK